MSASDMQPDPFLPEAKRNFFNGMLLAPNFEGFKQINSSVLNFV